MDAYERRYRRQLHDIGVAHAIAQHDPGNLDQAFHHRPASDGAEAAPDAAKKWW